LTFRGFFVDDGYGVRPSLGKATISIPCPSSQGMGNAVWRRVQRNRSLPAFGARLLLFELPEDTRHERRIVEREKSGSA